MLPCGVVSQTRTTSQQIIDTNLPRPAVPPADGAVAPVRLKRLRAPAPSAAAGRAGSGTRCSSASPPAMISMSSAIFGLARAVHLLLEPALQVLGVVGRRLHRAHARREPRTRPTPAGAQQLAVEVEREDGVEELGGLLLEDHVGHELGRGAAGTDSFSTARSPSLEVELEDLVALHLESRGQQRHERFGPTAST